MEQKSKPKPNVRTEPSKTTSRVDKKTSLKNKKELEENLNKKLSPARNKADEMETGFVKTRKSPILKEIENNNLEKTQQEISDTKEKLTSTQQKISTENFYNSDSMERPKRVKKIDTSEIDTSNSIKLNQITENTNNTIKGLQITLNPSICITALVTFIVTISFIFLFGLIIGKGMVPTADKIEPEKLTPQAQKVEEKVDVLPKEDLQFMTNLKIEQTVETPTEENSPIQAKEKTPQVQNIVPPKVIAPVIIPSTTLYDFNIRVAAFKSDSQANALRVKLEGIGLRTLLVVQKNAQRGWYFVHVLLRGTETRLREVQDSFKQFAIRDSIIKEKKEVK